MKLIICPICKKQTTWEDNEFRPFCSERCKMIDFGAWVDEEYAVSDVSAEDFPNVKIAEIDLDSDEYNNFA
jgi:uncharacterized protein